ncbi:tudor domain-containing protein 3-like isoform X2 [Crassostrea virginica]
MMTIVTKLKEMGWYLSGSGIEDCKAEADSTNVNKIVETAKDTDLKDIGEGWLPADVNKGKCEQIQGPGVLQIQKIRNVTAPKDNEESNHAPRMLKLVLTDGQMNCNAVEMEKLERIGLDTCPGSKICLNGKVEVEHGFLKLYNRNVRFVGGRVDKMADNWELRKKLSRQARVFVGSEGGPPAFTPFGQKTKDKKPVAFKKETQNFKSLETQTKEKKSEDAEFEQQRKAIIAEALQAKEEGKSINFGGQKQIGQDKDIARIVEMGFSASQASHALQQSNGDVNQAIDGLLNNERKPGGGDLRRERDGRREIPSRDDRRERGGRGRGRDNSENEDGEKSLRPSGPATLFDFLETKIKPEKDAKDSKERPRNSQPLQSFDNSSNRSGDNRTYNDRREPPMKQSERNDNRYNNRKSEYQQNDRSERSKPSYDSDRAYKNNDRGGSSYNSDRSYKNNDRGGSSFDSDRSYRNNDRGGSSYENKRGQGYRSEKPDRLETDRGKDRGQQRPPSDKGGYNDRKGRENKAQRGNNSDQANRPRTAYQDRRQGNQQDYQQDRPRSEMSCQDTMQKSRNPQNQPASRENLDSAGNHFNKSNRYFQQPPPSLPQFNPDVPPPPLLQQYNNFVPNQGGLNASWKRGDRCMAKYWEDNKFYSAVVENIDPRYPTVVVHFLEYGNSEEVSLSDVRPDPQFMGSMGNQGPSPLPQQQYASKTAEDSKIRSMEFRRKWQDQDNKQQKLYQPPNQQPLY